MLESVTSFFEWIRSTVENYPVIFAITAGMLISVLLTQTVKAIVPREAFSWLDSRKYVYYSVLRLLAFVLAFVPTWHMMPSDHRFKIWAALLAGALAPLFYKVAVMALYKRFPSLQTALSGRPTDVE